MPTPIDLLPSNLILGLAARYMAGKSANEALSLAHDIFRDFKYTSTLDILGEHSTTAEECQAFVETYRKVIDLTAEDPLPTQEKQKQLTISFKPSMFCALEPDKSFPSVSALDDGYRRIETIVAYGFRRGIPLTLEAEDSRWTDFHLRTYFSLLSAGYSNLGTVLQTRLIRTKKDIARFDEKCRVRLVTGIYPEKAEIAYQDKKHIKQLLLEYSRLLFEKGAYVELATHDEVYIEKFFAEVVLPLRISCTRFETQFLYGVPRMNLLQALACGNYFDKWKEVNGNTSDLLYLDYLGQSGIVVRLYLPFGTDAVAAPYCKRRLKSNPNLVLYGIKNILGIQ